MGIFTKKSNWTQWSGKRGSNPRPSAWKADALPTELLPLLNIELSLPMNDTQSPFNYLCALFKPKIFSEDQIFSLSCLIGADDEAFLLLLNDST